MSQQQPEPGQEINIELTPPPEDQPLADSENPSTTENQTESSQVDNTLSNATQATTEAMERVQQIQVDAITKVLNVLNEQLDRVNQLPDVMIARMTPVIERLEALEARLSEATTQTEMAWDDAVEILNQLEATDDQSSNETPANPIATLSDDVTALTPNGDGNKRSENKPSMLRTILVGDRKD